MEPLVIELDPLRAFGAVLLGSSREEAGQALRAWGEPVEHAPYPGALPLDWRCAGRGVDAYVHCGSAGVVQTIEVYRDAWAGPPARVVLFGLDLFASPRAEVLSALGARFELDAEDDEHVTVASLALGVEWREEALQSVLLAVPGYYDPPAR